jgi:hypothetical protein
LNIGYANYPLNDYKSEGNMACEVFCPPDKIIPVWLVFPGSSITLV